MDGRLKAALTAYLIREGVKPSRLGNIAAVEGYVYHYRTLDDCEIYPEVRVYYDKWTEDMTHSTLDEHTIEPEDFEDFLTHLANYRQES